MMERRLNAAGSVVGHKISMLQDLERGRSLEIDALVTAVQEMGRLVKVATPTIDTVLALVQERGRQAGLYGSDACAKPGLSCAKSDIAAGGARLTASYGRTTVIGS
jgi:2-dehydropantoate 2-reductase